MPRRNILIIVAVVIAAIGATLVFLYVKGIQSQHLAAQQPVEVLTATSTISPGETIDAAQSAGKLSLTSVPKQNVVPGALTNTASISGEVALSTVYPGEQIIPGQFGTTAAESAGSLTIPKGLMAVSVQLSDPARVAGFINPGSHVAIFVTASGLTGGPNGSVPLPDFTRLLLPNVQVIGVGSTTTVTSTTTDVTGAQTTEQLPRTILTLALNQRDAEKVIFSSTHGQLALGLLNRQSQSRADRGIAARNLFK